MRLAQAALLLSLWVLPMTGARAQALSAAAQAPQPSVGVYYFPGWYRSGPNDSSGEPGEWRTAIINAARPRALAGFYDDSDPRLWSYYIGWMKAAGIGFVAFDWYYNAGQQYLSASLDKGFLQAENNQSISYCVHWCNHGGGWWKKPLDQSRDALLEMTRLLTRDHFRRPNYLRIDGRPVLMVYDIPQLLAFGGESGVRSSLAQMRALARRLGLPGIYLVAIYPRSNPDHMRMLKRIGFDACTAYTYAWLRPATVRYDSRAIPCEDQSRQLGQELYPAMVRASHEAGIPYWPVCFPGWDDRPRAGFDNGLVITGSNPCAFARMLKAAVDNSDKQSPFVMIEAWNEWGEGACIEPSLEHGFGFLEAAASALGRPKPDWPAPSPEEIASWSILNGAELSAAEASRKKPWPDPEPVLYEFGKSYDAPKQKLPVVWDLSAEGMAAESLQLSQIKVLKQDADGLLLETTGSDPWLVLPMREVPASQIRRITILATLTAPPSVGIDERTPEVYWTTGLLPEFSGSACASPRVSDGRWSLDLQGLPAWKRSGTPLRQLRIDPCGAPGCKLLLRNVTLESSP